MYTDGDVHGGSTFTPQQSHGTDNGRNREGRTVLRVLFLDSDWSKRSIGFTIMFLSADTFRDIILCPASLKIRNRI